jgi:ParB family chromosome partitioning protein
MKTILRILERAGDYRPTLYLKIENPPYMALVIEATPEPGPTGLPAISIAHYGEQNGDLVRDPEMCFELSKLCANPDCPIHHASKQRPSTDAAFKAGQEKRRREEAIAQATGLRVLKATSDAVSVRLMKRDLLFVTEHLAAALDERRLAIIFRLHGIGKANGNAEAPAKLLASVLRKADESTIGRVLVAITVLQTAHSSNESAKTLREAAEFYKVDVAAITVKVKEEFAAKEKTQAARKVTGKAKPSQPHAAKKAKAA